MVRVRGTGLARVVRRVQLIHWKAEEAAPRVNQLRAAGYAAEHSMPDGNPGLRPLRENPPDAVVIDLTRLPSQGRDVAMALRTYKDTRCVPLVFAEGAPELIEPLRELLPDATYTSWKRIRSALRDAIARPPAEPVKPQSVLAGYSGTPLGRKLGIKPGFVVALHGAPDGFEKTLPPDATVRRGGRGRRDLTLWFVTSRRALDRDVDRFAEFGELWIVWPKKASGWTTDVSETVVRATGLAAGLVDYKICAIDATWSGLRFTRRKR